MVAKVPSWIRDEDRRNERDTILTLIEDPVESLGHGVNLIVVPQIREAEQLGLESTEPTGLSRKENALRCKEEGNPGEAGDFIAFRGDADGRSIFSSQILNKARAGPLVFNQERGTWMPLDKIQHGFL